MQKQLLTEDVMHKLFGVNYSNVLSFNFDTGRWNKRKYQGYKIYDQFMDTNYAHIVKESFDAVASEYGRELVALATCADDGVVTGALVVRNLHDGKIVVRPSDWFIVRQIVDKQLLANCIVSVFASKFVEDVSFRNSMLLNVVRSR